MEEPLISIIVPVYNTKRYIGECIESLMIQTYRNIEILVVDNGSDDGTYEICQEYGKKDERIRVMRAGFRQQHVARNTALEEMRGEYFSYVDADDYVSPDYIEKLKKRMDETGANLVITGRKEYRLNPDGTYTLTRELVPGNYERFSHEEWAMRFGEAWGKLYRRDFYDR